MSYIPGNNQHPLDSLASDMNNLSMGANSRSSVSLAKKKKQTSHVFDSSLMQNASGSPQIPSHVSFQGHPQEQYFQQDANPGFDPNAAAGSIGYTAPEFNNYQYGGAPAAGTQHNLPTSPNTQRMDQFQFNNNVGLQMQAPQMSQMPQASAPMDNHQIERNSRVTVPEYRYEASKEWYGRDFLTFQNACPPPAGTQYNIIDQGNASPEFIRMTMYNVPATDKLHNQTSIPLGLILRPFAPESFNGKPVPIVDFRSLNMVPRCSRCRTYVNPGMEQKNFSMVCNMCKFESKLPTEYSAPLNSNGKRMDYLNRPELHAGVYDIVLPDEYLTEGAEYKPVNHVFLIDVSHEAIKNELHKAAVEAIRMSLYGEGECKLPQGSKISIITYDENVNFYDLSPDLEQVSVSIMADTTYPFVPFHDGIFADPMESYGIIESTLNVIESATHYVHPGCCFGTALKCAQSALKESGNAKGQIIALLASNPNAGTGILPVKVKKSDQKQEEFDRIVITAGSEYYNRMATEMIEDGIGVNVFIATSGGSVSLADVANVAERTGGIVKSWYGYNANLHEIDLTSSIADCVAKIKAYDVVLKVRCSSGLQVKKYYGGFTSTGKDTEPTFSIAHEDTTIECDFVYDGKLNTKHDAHFQAALLYTAADGGRRARIINCIVAVTEKIDKACEFADQDATVALMLREAASRLPQINFTALRSYLSVQISDILASYKSLVAQHSSTPGDLVFPHGLSTMALFLLAASKSKALKELTANPDFRVQSLNNLNLLPLSKLSVYLYPTLTPLHDLGEVECTIDEETGLFVYPTTVPLSLSSLQLGGAYLLFNGFKFILWIHSDVNPLLLQDLLGPNIDSVSKIDYSICNLFQMDNHLSEQVNNLIKHFTKYYSNQTFCPVHICLCESRSSIESEFLEMMYEDRGRDMSQSYPDYLKSLHKKISAKLENKHSSPTDAIVHSGLTLF